MAGSDGINGTTTVRKTEKWIKHYRSSHRILLVGEGDFSFSACLGRAFGSAENMVATSLDSKEMLASKHWSSVAHVEELRRSGCLVLHDVDVKDMKENSILKRRKFDRIIFNFPHAGHSLLLGERDLELIQKHKQLLAAFFRSSREMISEGGEIHVAHRNDYPYVRWNLKKLAKKAGLFLIEMVEFQKADYPGYHHKRGGGIRSNQTFPLMECFTFKFSLQKCSQVKGSSRISSQIDVSMLLKYYSDMFLLAREAHGELKPLPKVEDTIVQTSLEAEVVELKPLLKVEDTIVQTSLEAHVELKPLLKVEDTIVQTSLRNHLHQLLGSFIVFIVRCVIVWCVLCVVLCFVI